MCIPMSFRHYRPPPDQGPLNILLSNGRFPVSLDLARQLTRGGHRIFVVDPMHYHVCFFSAAVVASVHAPAPRVNPSGYIASVLAAIKTHSIHTIIPLHEEILFLASSNEPEILSRLMAPPWEVLISLHNKWQFSKVLEAAGLGRPRAWLLQSRADLEGLPREEELAVKPCLGRASANVFKVKPGEELPGVGKCSPGGGGRMWIAQEWVKGDRYCTYSIVKDGSVIISGIYPVMDTIDGSSCVYFESVRHPQIEAYITTLISHLPHFTAQLAFDFIATPTRLVSIECNPRATSGIHLFSGTSRIPRTLFSPEPPPTTIYPPERAHRQLAPGMLMWRKHAEEPRWKAYAKHMKRLVSSRDVIFSKTDPMPSLMQPFLLTSYYEICRERKLRIAEMFQWDLCWEPEGGEVVPVEDGKSVEDRMKDVAVGGMDGPSGQNGVGDGKVVERRDSGVEERRDSGVQERRDSGMQERRDSGVQERRDSGVV